MSVEGKGIVLKEPTVVAIDTRNDTFLAVGDEAFKMVGKTPSYIKSVFPLEDGVISNYNVTKDLIKAYISKVYNSHVVKPRVCVCVPSNITGVENDAVVEAAISAGARQVFLIEEPMAAAMGCGIDISLPNGNMVIDIGGGTTDTAIISLGGGVISRSIKIGGNAFDREIVRYIRMTYGLIVGERSAEQLKIEIGSADEKLGIDNKSIIKGISLRTHLPQTLELTTKDLYAPINECAVQILDIAKQTLEKTPPELSGDIYQNGVYLTGGGALLTGLDSYISRGLGVAVHLAEDSENCVVRGTAIALTMSENLENGFRDATPKMR
ncbi:MAG: rod shape-determining protein [Oscillospiraceae bacterium]